MRQSDCSAHTPKLVTRARPAHWPLQVESGVVDDDLLGVAAPHPPRSDAAASHGLRPRVCRLEGASVSRRRWCTHSYLM